MSTSHYIPILKRNSMKLGLILLLATLATAFAAEESCMGRCENGFDAQKSCQCDSMCRYYKSCCLDYETACRMRTRGDTFVFAEDDEESLDSTPTPVATINHTPTVDSGYSGHQRGPRRHDSVVAFSTTPATQASPVTKATTVPTAIKVPDTQKESRSPQDPTTDSHVRPNIPTTGKSHIKVNVPTTEKDPRREILLRPNLATPEPTTAPVTTTERVTTTKAPDPDAEACSGRPFDSFMQMKNGSIYAFRGEYFFVLDEKSVLPGYPKLIKDVWGIKGPIDAAFTRINCQGKTYIFKRNQYWRFDDGVLDEDYPRDITVGFTKIPDNIDAAFAMPAHSHHGKEKVYFFKGDQYYQYEFLHQPTHEECISMSERSPSTIFQRYTDVYYNNWESFYHELFGGKPIRHDGHHFINKDWVGIKSPVDAVMGGRIYVAPWVSPPGRNDRRPEGNYRPNQQWGQQWGQQRGQQWEQQQGQQWGHRRQNRSPFWESMAERGMDMGQGFAERGMDMGQGFAERGMDMGQGFAKRGMEKGQRLTDPEMAMREMLGSDLRQEQDWDQDQDRRRDYDYRRHYESESYYSRYPTAERHYWELVRKGQPLQSVYFFKADKYYRVDLKTKKVDFANPPYPRSIAKYWLSCPENTKAEKK
ncbi:vitronectin a [Osmerus eperlanus]|uniref:vitronectin a n=1 Tax=Osmerus eperlanus TaxID=29151 RepID=UPI002E0F5B76